MLQTSARLLRLLTLLQSRRQWAGKELSERLEIDARTVRRDVDRLRELGYPIRASSGLGGGYQLGPGSSTPPVLLSDDEAVAVAMALRAAAGSVGKMEETAIGLLAKLDQVMPARLRKRASALHSVTISLGNVLGNAQPVPSMEVLTRVAAACRDHMRLKLAYKDREGKSSSRVVEPLRLAHTGSRWYLVAWDTEREDWRTFRVDRVDRLIASGPPFTPRKFPGDVAAYVSKSMRHVSYRYRMRIRIQGTVESLSKQIPRWCGILEAADGATCTLTTGADSVEMLASLMVMTAADFEILDSHELVPELRKVAERLSRATMANV